MKPSIFVGKFLVRCLDDGNIIVGRIVETEAYPGFTDVASHSYKGKTERNQAMFMPPGTCYVYYIYGRQNCVNVSSVEEGGAVLLRAVEPIEGHSVMMANRNKTVKSEIHKLSNYKDCCNGPSKLCQALNITKEEFNCTSFLPPNDDSKTKIESPLVDFYPKLFLANSVLELVEEEIVTSTRIGIDGCGAEAASKLFRFYIRNNYFVSVLHKDP